MFYSFIIYNQSTMNILITGASRGIGAELAYQLSNGKHHMILLSRNKKNLTELSKRCNDRAGRKVAVPLVFDLSDIENESDNLLRAIGKELPVLDVLVNNAGMVLRNNFEAISPEDSKKVFEVNYFAPAMLTRLCLPLLKASGHASVINITSMAGFQGSMKFSGLSHYAASKAALGALTELLAVELKDDNIHVNALSFGAVQTEMLAEAFPGYKAPVNASEMASFVAWFVEEGWKHFNGKILPVTSTTP